MSHKDSRPAESLSTGDTITIKKSDTEIVKIYKYLKIAAGIIGSSLVIFSVGGQVYKVPQKFEEQAKVIESHTMKIDNQEKTIAIIKNDVNESRHIIVSMQKSVEGIELQQKVDTVQNEQVNRNLIELNANLGYIRETLKELKEDVKDVKKQTHNP